MNLVLTATTQVYRVQPVHTAMCCEEISPTVFLQSKNFPNMQAVEHEVILDITQMHILISNCTNYNKMYIQLALQTHDVKAM